MSLILDALRKSDRQRNRRAAEQLRWGPEPARSNDTHGVPLWAAGLAVLLLTVIGLGGWLVYRGAAPSGQTSAVSGEPTEVVDNEPQAARPARATVRSLSAELAPTQTEGSSEPSSETHDATATPSAPAATEPRLLAPALSEMDADFRKALPELMLNVHAWTENPEQRFVMINMHRYAEGDRLQEGPLLRQITPNGVVLEFRNTLFTLSQ